MGAPFLKGSQVRSLLSYSLVIMAMLRFLLAIFWFGDPDYVTSFDMSTTILFNPEEEGGSGSKRLKGLGIGSPDGPVSLDDVRRLEKSNAVSCSFNLQ